MTFEDLPMKYNQWFLSMENLLLSLPHSRAYVYIPTCVHECARTHTELPILSWWSVLYLKWITDKDLLHIAHGTLSNVMWQSGWEGTMDTCICTAESLHRSPATITTLLTDYTPIQNKKLKKYEMNPLITKCFMKTKTSQRAAIKSEIRKLLHPWNKTNKELLKSWKTWQQNFNKMFRRYTWGNLPECRIKRQNNGKVGEKT